MVANTLGSNYDLRDALQLLTASGNYRDAEALRVTLEKRFDGEAHLYHKGRSALASAIKLIGGTPKVGINAFTCYVVEEAVSVAGGTPIFMDIDKHNYHYGIGQLEEAHRKYNLSVVVIQNTFGLPCDIAAIEAFCKQEDIILVEDLAHGISGHYADKRKFGTVGDFVMLSFGRDKQLDVVNGGALIIRSDKYKGKLEQKVDYPKMSFRLKDRLYPILTVIIRATHKYYLGKIIHSLSRKTGLIEQSANGSAMPFLALAHHKARIVSSQLAGLEADGKRRAQLTEIYTGALPASPLLRLPIVSTRRPTILKNMSAQGYHLYDIWYDVPVYPKRMANRSQYQPGSCTSAEEVSKEVLNLPLHKNVSSEDAVALRKLAA